MRNLDQQEAPSKNGSTTVATKTKYRDFNDFLGRKQQQQPEERKEDEGDRKAKVPYSSYKEFLENYNTKRFSSVRPAVPTKTMKSEIFIQVNGDGKPKAKIEEGASMTFTKNLKTMELPVRVEEKPVNFTKKPKNMVPPPPPPPMKIEASTNGVEEKSTKPVALTKTPPAAPQFFQNAPPPPPPPFFDDNYKKSKTLPPPPDFLQNEAAVPAVPEFLENLLRKRAAALQRGNEVEISTMTSVPVVDETDRIDKNDPNVKKLVYNTYRGLLGAYNHKANDIISTLPRHCVREDRGIAKQLESIA